MYKLIKSLITGQISCVQKQVDNVLYSIPFDQANTDYQAFKSAVLNQEPGGAVVEDGESFGLNDNPDASILEDADGVQMTIDQAKAFVATLP